jgi:hypothetical protein
MVVPTVASDLVVALGLSGALAGRIRRVNLQEPTTEMGLGSSSSNMEAMVARVNKDSREETLEVDQTEATSMLAINVVPGQTLELLPSPTITITVPMATNGKRRGKRRSARRSCAARWRSLGASEKLKQRKRRGNGKEKRWRRS